ncbi:hypothetical protein HanIR_Chr01g0024071 [Helianthus annuus]|nr:hypothetical protein HanIR_Chr01g0024071 [Helianthus annuus]
MLILQGHVLIFVSGVIENILSRNPIEYVHHIFVSGLIKKRLIRNQMQKSPLNDARAEIRLNASFTIFNQELVLVLDFLTEGFD